MVTGRHVLTLADRLASVGGTEAAQLAIFEGLAGRGWRVDLLYRAGGDYSARWAALAAGTEVVGGYLPERSDPLASAVAAVRAVRAGRRTRPDLVYVHNAGDVPAALAVAGRRPVAVHLHLPPPIRQPGWLDRVLRRASLVITPSTDTSQRWIDRAGLAPGRVRTVPVGVDLERFTPRPEAERLQIRRGLGVDDAEPMILYAGRIQRIKGAHFLLEAAAGLVPRPRVVLCGGATEADYLAELQRLDPGALFLGPRPDVPELMAAADLVVMPSNWLETQGLVISEAMASGTPVVASSVGGLTDSMAGFPDQLVPPADPAALARAIDRYLPWRRQEPDLGPRSRAWVEANLSMDATVARIDQELAALTGR